MTDSGSHTGQMTELRVAISDVVDPEYVEQQGGAAYYTHLRGAERIVEFRLRGVGRAYEQYERARSEGAAEPEVAGFGLLVLQRAFLAAEDLGGLLYAVSGAERWVRLTSYYAYQLDDLFLAVLERRQNTGAFFLLPSDEQVDASPKLDESARAATRKLRQITLEATRDQFDLVAAFWMGLREPAKSTMHGFGIVAAEHLITPPGGGQLSEFVDPTMARPFALALITQEDKQGKSAETFYHPLDLTPEQVALVKFTGLVAGELYLIVARTHRDALRQRQPWTLPSAYAAKLSDDERRSLEKASG